jgi:hypothetical protein
MILMKGSELWKTLANHQRVSLTLRLIYLFTHCELGIYGHRMGEGEAENIFSFIQFIITYFCFWHDFGLNSGPPLADKCSTT